MADGIRIQDAALEISSPGLESLLKKQGTEVTVTKLDLSATQDALNTLLATPPGTSSGSGPASPPRLEISEGRLQLSLPQEGGAIVIDLRAKELRVEIQAGGIHLVTG